MKQLIKILMFSHIILASLIGYGQDNPENLINIDEKDSLIAEEDNLNFVEWFNKRIKYKITTDGYLAKGNVNRVLFVGRSSVAYVDSIIDLSLAPVYLYGKQNNNLAEDDYSGTMYLNLFHEKKIFQWTLALFEHSRLRGIDERHNYGGGIGWNILKKKETQSLSITTGLLYEKADFTAIPDMETWRNSTRLKGKHKVFHKHVKFIHETFLQPSVLNSFDLRWRTLLSFEAPINHHISARIAYQHTHESIILPTKVRDDYNITFGLAFSN